MLSIPFSFPVNPAVQGVFMVAGPFLGLLVAAFGGVLVFKGRTAKWPAGF
jgi:hypothetical protein